MENVILDNETKCYNTRSDHAAVVHVLLRNALDEVREERVVSIPEFDKIAPLDVPVSVRRNPFVLRVTLPAEFAVDRGQHETDMVVCRRIDQVTQFFFARPAAGPSIRCAVSSSVSARRFGSSRSIVCLEKEREHRLHESIFPRACGSLRPSASCSVRRAMKKFAILCHRWTGTAFCVLFAWWFISGIFMMYVDYPEVNDSNRLAHAQAIDASRVQLTAAQAWASLKTKGEPDEVRLRMFDSRPAYWFRLGKARAYVYADNGRMQVKFPPELNLRTAAAWTGQPAADATSELMTSEDQWTVGGLYFNYEPLTKYSWPDGQQVYIPRATGEVVQYTTRASRLLVISRPGRALALLHAAAQESPALEPDRHLALRRSRQPWRCSACSPGSLCIRLPGESPSRGRSGCT